MYTDEIYNALTRVVIPNRTVVKNYTLAIPSKDMIDVCPEIAKVANPFIVWNMVSSVMYNKLDLTYDNNTVYGLYHFDLTTITCDIAVIRNGHVEEVYFTNASINYFDTLDDMNPQIPSNVKTKFKIVVDDHLYYNYDDSDDSSYSYWSYKDPIVKYIPCVNAQLSKNKRNQENDKLETLFKQLKNRKVNKITQTVWNKLYKEDYGNCHICGVPICIKMFQKCHVQSKYMHGKTNTENLLPGCKDCNLAMQTMNYNDFKGLVHQHGMIEATKMAKANKQSDKRKENRLSEIKKTWTKSGMDEVMSLEDYTAIVQVHTKQKAKELTCKAKTKNGKSCSHKALYGEYCGTHKDTKSTKTISCEQGLAVETIVSKLKKKTKKNTNLQLTCMAKTKNGDCCTNPAKNNGYCGLHKYNAKCKGKTKSGKRCSKTPKYNGYCVSHK